MTLKVINTDVVKFSSVSMPEFGLTSVNETMPGEIFTLKAVDLKSLVSGENDAVVLATAVVTANGVGTSPINLAVRALDDDSGNPIDADISDFSLSVK